MESGGAMTPIHIAQHPMSTVQKANFIQNHPEEDGTVISRRVIVTLSAAMRYNHVLLLVTEKNANGNMVEKSNAQIHVTSIRKKPANNRVDVNIHTVAHPNRLVLILIY